MAFSARLHTFLRPLVFFSRFAHWVSAVVVLGIASSYIHNYGRDNGHLLYHEVVSATAVAFFILPLFCPFIERITWHVLPLDMIYSYLWLTSFVFAAQDYGRSDCTAFAPGGTSNCTLKHALEAFSFLAFFFSWLSMIKQNLVWVNQRDVLAHDVRVDKSGPAVASASQAV